jgi:hypothetical protein
LRQADLIMLQAAFVVFCLPLTAALYLHTYFWRALGMLPIGMPVLSLCIRLNYRSASQSVDTYVPAAGFGLRRIDAWLDAVDLK